MRHEIKVNTSTNNNTKTTTTTQTTYISVRDIVGFAKSGIAVAKAIKAASANPPTLDMFKKIGIAGLIAPLFSLAMGLEIVQKVLQVIAIVTPIAQMVARAGGIGIVEAFC